MWLWQNDDAPYYLRYFWESTAPVAISDVSVCLINGRESQEVQTFTHPSILSVYKLLSYILYFGSLKTLGCTTLDDLAQFDSQLQLSLAAWGYYYEDYIKLSTGVRSSRHLREAEIKTMRFSWCTALLIGGWMRSGLLVCILLFEFIFKGVIGCPFFTSWYDSLGS